jgi:aspartyl-tRNA(Asn)/glutamyl-tRNA(Gln) amidotransferase subunit B
MSVRPKLKVGLEIHTQLQTISKLFSLSPNSTSNLSIAPNTTTSFFDVSLPGTQPKLNHQCLLNSLKLAISLNCEISSISSFDRKHYFYGDQPLGYQLTQHYNPIAKNGYLNLLKKYNSKLSRDVKINIQQLQIEQDTGRSIYHSINSNSSNIDFNRSNIPLIEMVTLPDFENINEVRAFLQNYIKLVQDLKICTGDLETGALRVDVNINVTGHQRVEIKNLPTISAIINAIRYEEKRQLLNISNNNLSNEIETRGWDGKKTYHLRSKESTVDYRYVPDMELPKIKLNLNDLLPKIEETLPISVNEKLAILMNSIDKNGYSLTLRDAKILINNDLLLNYFKNCWEIINDEKIKIKIINWLVHELLGALTKNNIEFNDDIISTKSFTDLIISVETGLITKSNGKLILLHLVSNKNDQLKNIKDLADEFGMIASENSIDSNDLDNLVNKIINENEKIANEIRKGKVKKINFLIGLLMRETGGNIPPKVFEDRIKHFLEI